MLTRLKDAEGYYAGLSEKLSQPDIAADPHTMRRLMLEYRRMTPIIEKYREYKAVDAAVTEAEALLSSETDEELCLLAEEERKEGKKAMARLLDELTLLLLPRDPNDDKNVVVEIRAGAGGEEAALFAATLYRMYSMYAASVGYRMETVSSNPTELGGYREIVFMVEGDGAYSRFRFESGVHRVQRVPETEAQGRIHTSAATVVVFPEADEDDELDIPEKDIRIDLFCAGGAGGQHVNKTESAVRMTHLPTGLVAVCQDERSQIRNREKCLATLKARILDHRRREEEAKLGADRLSLRGSGDRSERIRTYNFPQNRMTDHRVDLTLYSLERIMEGELQQLLDALRENDVDDRIKLAIVRTEEGR